MDNTVGKLGGLYLGVNNRAVRALRDNISLFIRGIWKYQILRNFVLGKPKYVPSNKSWRFRTISHPEITEIYRLFYKQRRKTLPENLESIIRDKLALAVWFMDDGCKDTVNGIEKGLILNTQNFNLHEQY